MSVNLFIPKLGQTVEEVILVNWLVPDGTKVELGTTVLEVETDKALFPIEANANGFLHIGPYKAGDLLPVLCVVATIGDKDDEFLVQNDTSKTGVETVLQVLKEGVSQLEARNVTVQDTSERQFISPRARMFARGKNVDLTQVPPTGGEGIRITEKDIRSHLSHVRKVTPVAAKMVARYDLDLKSIEGSGSRGTVTKADVERAVARRKTSDTFITPSPVDNNEVNRSVSLTGFRKTIFERMEISAHTTARVTLMTEVDATNLVTVREKLKVEKQQFGFSPDYNDFLGIIVARSLRDFPFMNARIHPNGKVIEWLNSINLGIAVDTERGLIVPVVQNADQKTLRQFGLEVRELIERSRTGRSRATDLSGGSFTITNLGMYGIDAFTPIINLPEAAILGIGRIQDKVVPYQNEISIRKVLTLSLAFDHRLNDGAPAARFLQGIKRYIENPLLLL